MKLKITERGWAGFTGQLGEVDFEDGISTEVTETQARRLANIIQIETLDGRNPSASQNVLDSQAIEMKQGMDHVAVQSTVAATQRSFTKEELEKIAEERGIGGLRAIAEPLGIVGRSINILINAIIAQQANFSTADLGLAGSSKLPSVVKVGDVTHQAGDIVSAAFKKADMTVEAWNEQPEEIREQKLAEYLATLKA